jgi:hypothetical protein
MKRLLIKWGVIALLCLIVSCTIWGMARTIKNQQEMIDNALQNVSAYASEADSLENQCKIFKMDIVTLVNLNDSIMKKMYNQAQKLKIKDKQIEALQYRADHTEKIVEIHTRDTIFISPNFTLDTCLVDKWSNICLHLEYPNKVGVNAKFDNEQYIIIHSKKVPVKPRKCKIAEWFTRKRTEVTVDVISESPYVITKKQRFVEIIK